ARPAEDAAWEEVLGREPSPAVAAELAEAYRRLLDCLPDAELRSLAVWKMEGDSVEELTQKLNCSPRSVKRMTRLIREGWQREVEGGASRPRCPTTPCPCRPSSACTRPAGTSRRPGEADPRARVAEDSRPISARSCPRSRRPSGWPSSRN